ncbi:hypothetical protein K438DRAFT_1829820 [Mycena galopus ATCC 62051]|nr:hypothetical protein K438DRAFT_1829820 [Mycena galopus ATCC 62051]
MLHALEEVSPLFEGPDDREHFLVVDFVIALDVTQTFGVERDWMPLSVCVWLRQDGPGGIVGAVRLDSVQTRFDREDQDGLRGHHILEGLESSSCGAGPGPRYALLREVEEGLRNVRERLDEPPVEVCEAKELLHVLLVLRGGPGGDSGDLDWVHLDVVVQDDDAEVLD